MKKHQTDQATLIRRRQAAAQGWLAAHGEQRRTIALALLPFCLNQQLEGVDDRSSAEWQKQISESAISAAFYLADQFIECSECLDYVSLWHTPLEYFADEDEL